jgi:hypothetical protein
MLRKVLSTRGVIPVVLSLQVVPLLALPPASYKLASQVWWLPALLTFLVVLALVQILVRRSSTPTPWYLLSFTQGINIISRLMMLLPHTTSGPAAARTFDGVYVAIAVLAMLWSAFNIWYNELTEVRRRLLAG